jgi:hypothetical protein
MIRRSQQMASYSEKILDDTVEGERPLGLVSRFEAAHLPFPLAGRLMRGFSAIVGVAFRVVSHVAKQFWKPMALTFDNMASEQMRLIQ